MAHSNYVPPAVQAAAFNCASCGIFAKQEWFFMSGAAQGDGFGRQFMDQDFLISHCAACGSPTIWRGDQLIYPAHSTAEPPNQDLPDDIKADFEEARAILNQSPRGAAALLRLAIQKLCEHLGQPGKNINTDIGALVSLGLPVKVQQALDSVRVIGNDAVHPGSIDLRDDRDTAAKLFKLVNFIAHKTITEPKEIEEIYNGLPADKRSGIERRDSQPPRVDSPEPKPDDRPSMLSSLGSRLRGR